MKKLDIIYEDKEILVINKPSGKLTISDGKTTNTLYSEAKDYLNKKNQKIFIVHRLDKDTSGVILFAKNVSIKNYLQNNWNDLCITREYYAIVSGVPKEKKGSIKVYLKETKDLFVYVTNDSKFGKLAITDYEVIKQKGKYSHLKIEIKTGRKNQIRASLAYIDCPIIGDKKYKSTDNPIGRLGLHASKLNIKIHDKEYTFEANIPKNFNTI